MEVTLSSLLSDLEDLLSKAKTLESKSSEVLNSSNAPGKWSDLQIIEHLNIAYKQYAPIIQKALSEAKVTEKNENHIRPSWFGKMFIYYAGPESLKKLAAPKKFKPIQNETLDKDRVLGEYSKGVQELMDFIIEGKTKQLHQKKYGSPITWMIRFYLGEILLLLVRHQQRHVMSIKV